VVPHTEALTFFENIQFILRRKGSEWKNNNDSRKETEYMEEEEQK
jgi:hypothetical protein